MSDKKKSDTFAQSGFGPADWAGAGWNQPQGFAPNQSFGPQAAAEQPAPGPQGPMQGVPYPPPPPPWAGYYAPPPMPPFYGMPPVPPMGMPPYMDPMAMGYGAAQSSSATSEQPGFSGMHNILRDLTNGGNPLNALGKLFDLKDGDFLKGAAVGAAVVLLMNNDEVKDQLRSMLSGFMPNGDAEESQEETDA